MKNRRQKIRIIYIATVILLVSLAFSNIVLASEINSDNVIQLVNQARDDQGIGILKENSTLDKIAQDKLNDMIANGYFAHTSPKGISPWYWFQKEGYDYKYAGENLAINFTKAEDQQKAWMESPTHRKNILNINYQEIGVAVGAGEINGQTSIIAVQEFGKQDGAVETLNDQKNFSGKDKVNLIKEGEKIGPSVLSVKDVTNDSSGGNAPQNNGQNDLAKALKNAFEKNSQSIIYYSYLVNVLLVLLSLTLAPAVFVFMAFARSISHNGNTIAVKFTDNINEIKWIKIRTA